MYSLISVTGSVGIRLPKGAREAFLAQSQYQSTIYEHMAGAPLKEYVTVPEALLGDTAKLSEYLAASHAYALTLKPKPTKKS